jgi:hypothetical protein
MADDKPATQPAKIDPEVQRGEYAKTVLAQLQKAASGPALRGVVLTGSRPEQDGLQLLGLVNQAEQLVSLRTEANRVLNGLPEGKKLFPRGVSVAGLPVLQGGDLAGLTIEPLRTVLQRHFAGSPQIDAEHEYYVRQTRLDSVAYDETANSLVVAGVCLAPTFQVPAAADKPVHPRIQIGEAITDLLARKTRIGPINLDVKRIVQYSEAPGGAKLVNPIVALQRWMVEERHHDDFLVHEGIYDAQGRLVLRCFAEQDSYLEEVNTFCKGRPRSDPAFRPDRDPAAPGWIVDREDLEDGWPLQRTRFQASLAASGEPFEQVRLDRVYLTYSDDGLELHFCGLCCFPGLLTNRDIRTQIRDFLSGRAYRAWPALRGRLQAAVVLPEADLKYVAQPGPTLQARLAEDSSFDGTVFFDGTRPNERAGFDAAGRLMLRGHRLEGPGQEERLLSIAQKILRDEEGNPLARKGLSLSLLTPSPVPQLLPSLRRWLADREGLEDTWLQRLFFNKESILELQGIYTATESISLEKELQEQKLRAFPGARIKLEAFDPRNRRDGLAHFLRTILARDGRWDGVLLERCYYEPDGTYVLTGLLEEPRQAQDLNDLLREATSLPRRRLLSGQSWSLKELQVLRLQPMLSKLRKVMPAYPELDGLLIERVYHDADRKLVFACRLVGSLANRAAREKRVQELLDGDPNYRRRSAWGVEFRYLEVLPRNPELAEQALVRAQQALHERDCTAGAIALDEALLHEPGDSLAWSLRALLDLLNGDKLLAERDLRRMFQVEMRPSGLANPARRQERMERVQGDFRQLLTDTTVKVWKDMINKKPPLTLKDL